MAELVNKVPLLPRPKYTVNPEQLAQFDMNIAKQLLLELTDHARRINLSLPKDGTERPTAPMPLIHSTVAELPAATSWEGALLYLSNESGGATLAFSDGIDWRRVQDRAIVS